MMRQMREATKPIMLLAAGAFVALMVFEWGMDASGRSSGGFGEIGRVNGTPVMYDNYMAAYRSLYDQAQQSQEEPITSQQNRDLEDQAWEEAVNQILIRQELERRGIDVTDEEIRQAARFSPPQDLRPNFTNEQGQFDAASYQQFLAQLPQEQLLMLEAYYRDVIPRGKLLRQVSSGIFLSDAELWQRYRDQNERVEIRYVPVNPATRFADSLFTVSETEARAYYDEHQDEFEVPARATVKFVVMNKAPTAADTAASLQTARDVQAELEADGEWDAVAARESSDQGSAQSGGDLGVFAKGRMVAPFDSVVFAGPTGRVLEPVQTSFGYHVIEVQQRWGQDSAQARHVLVPVARTDDSEIRLLTLADSLEDLSETVGLDAAATQLGLTVGTQEITAAFPFVTGAGQIGEGSDWAFEEAAPGDVSPVFENAQAFYALELVSAEEAGILSFEEALPAIESTLIFDKKMARGTEEADRILALVRAGEALPNAAAELGMEVRQAGPFSRVDFVPGVGRQNAAVGTAFGLTVGEVSEAVATPANVFVIELLGREPADSTAWLDQRDQQRAQTVAALQQQRLQEWITALRDAARVVDRRAEVLQPADEDQQVQLPMMF
ncbi:MAG: SurA N-terminal domain-containing protein [Longimicrobiales bacterium]